MWTQWSIFSSIDQKHISWCSQCFILINNPNHVTLMVMQLSSTRGTRGRILLNNSFYNNYQPMMLFMWGFLIGHRGRVACAGETPHFITTVLLMDVQKGGLGSHTPSWTNWKGIRKPHNTDACGHGKARRSTFINFFI